MTTLYDLDSYVRSHKPRRRGGGKPAGVPPGRGSGSAVAAALARARARAMAAPGARRALALSRPLDFEVPGTVAELRQPTRMACWATTFTMLVAWRDQRSMSIEATLGTIGKKWVDLFKADTGSSAEQEAELWAAAGLVAEPLASHTLESWEGLLRAYGPLAVIVDVDPGDKRAIHMLMVTGIHGDGTADGTTATVVDPARGDKRPVKFSTLLGQYEQGAARRTASGRHNQIVHWPKDVRFAGARAYGSAHAFTAKPSPPAKAPAPSAPLGPQPWSHYFQFRKGSTFEVDGPLSYNGTGEVLERTADHLKFTMKMPAVSIFGQSIPAADMVVEATYKKEGKGNHVRAAINGQTVEDTNAEIVSSGRKRTIRPTFTGLAGPAPEWISVEPDGDDEVDLDMRIDGRDVDFDLNRTSGSSGMALGLEPWSHSFPFAGGTAFTVDGPLGFDGHGRVLERSDTFLKFEMNMPAASVLGKQIPKLDLVLEATYLKEGPGNQAAFIVNGTRHADANASITSDRARRTIVPSIVIPGSKVERIAFGPDGRDTIDLDATIDGTTHDFDLEKVKGPAAHAWVQGLASSSTAADALREVAAFAARTGATRWKISRADVARRLRDLVSNPDLVDQGALNLCGPAAFFHVFARRDPVAFARYAADLFEKGEGAIGTLKVKPGAHLVTNDYARIVPRMNPVTPVAEWMCLGALRDSENAAIEFEGDPSENLAGLTTPGELASWMKKSGIYTKVSDEGNWLATKGFNHAMALAPAPNRDILMLINANIIQAPSPGRKKLLDAFPNHFIQLHTRLSTVQRGGSQFVEFDYWTWGMPGSQHASVSTRAFIDNYYGTVTGEV